MSENPPAPGAVFLRYASQDAERATCTCAALRFTRVEDWFDQSDREGGVTGLAATAPR